MISKERLSEINEDLEQSNSGWFLDSDGKRFYFLSIFDRDNTKEKLIFEVDFEAEELITTGFRLNVATYETNAIHTESIHIRLARAVAQYIKDKFL